MNNDSLIFAVIGCGAFSRGQDIPNIARSSRATLHTCCALSGEALKECKDTHAAQNIDTNWRRVVENSEVETICLATTESLRRPVIQLAAEKGKPVYVEKLLARTMEEVYEIQKVVNDSGIPFCVGHNRRYSPALIDAQRIFRSHMETP